MSNLQAIQDQLIASINSITDLEDFLWKSSTYEAEAYGPDTVPWRGPVTGFILLCVSSINSRKIHHPPLTKRILTVSVGTFRSTYPTYPRRVQKVGVSFFLLFICVGNEGEEISRTKWRGVHFCDRGYKRMYCSAPTLWFRYRHDKIRPCKTLIDYKSQCDR